jgi:hypothetical protein
MSDLYQQIVSQRGSFENILNRIPGFSGYLDRATRRTADRMLRDYIASQLTIRINRISDIERRLLDDGGLAYMSETRSAKDNLQTFRDRVSGAAPGYSGFMESVKVDSEELERIYAFDEALIRYLDQIDEAVKKLDDAATSKTGVDEAIRGLDQLTREANEAFSLRDDVLTNLDKSLSGNSDVSP